MKLTSDNLELNDKSTINIQSDAVLKMQYEMNRYISNKSYLLKVVISCICDVSFVGYVAVALVMLVAASAAPAGRAAVMGVEAEEEPPLPRTCRGTTE